MLIIKVESESGDLLGVARITNDGTGNETHGNYNAEFSVPGEPTKVLKTVWIKNFPRKKLEIWDILAWSLILFLGRVRLRKFFFKNTANRPLKRESNVP